MKKSVIALFFALFALFNVSTVYADDPLPDVAATEDEPLPPLMEEGGN